MTDTKHTTPFDMGAGYERISPALGLQPEVHFMHEGTGCELG